MIPNAFHGFFLCCPEPAAPWQILLYDVNLTEVNMLKIGAGASFPCKLLNMEMQIQ